MRPSLRLTAAPKVLLGAGVVAAAAALVLAFLPSGGSTTPIRQPGPVVVVAMPTLRWDQVDALRTPALWSLVRTGAVGAIATRTPAGRSCTSQSWVTFAAGSPTDAGPRRCASVEPRALPGGAAVFDGWAGWRAQAAAETGDPDLGSTASLLAGAGECVAAAGPGAALGAANRAGVVAHYATDPADVDLTSCPVTLVSFPRPDDAALGALEARLLPGTTVIVTGAADDGSGPTFRPVVVSGPGVSRGRLTSLSTRQPGLVQNADLSALVVSRLGAAAPVVGVGRVPVVVPEADGPVFRTRSLVHALDVEQPFVGRFFALFLGGAALALGALGAAWLRLRRRGDPASGRRRTALRTWAQMVAAGCAATPVAVLLAGLVPWWRSVHPELALTLAVLFLAGCLGALAVRGPWRRSSIGPALFLLGATFLVDAVDVVHGSSLQLISLMGLQPVYGSRYYGQGNVAFAIFATSGLLIGTLLAGRLATAGRRRAAVGVVLALGVVTLLVDGAPWWGADGGGSLALAPAFGYLALRAGGWSLTWRRVGIGVGATLAIVASLSLADYLGPVAYRTHLGAFVTQLVDQGHWQGLTSIWSQNWTMLTSSWFTALVPVLLLAVVLALRGADRWIRSGLSAKDAPAVVAAGARAVVTCWVLAFLTNDSGTAIPPSGLLVALPVLIVLGLSGRTWTPDEARLAASVTTTYRPNASLRSASFRAFLSGATPGT